MFDVQGGPGSPLQATSTPRVFAALAAGAAKICRRLEGILSAHLATRAAATAVLELSERCCLARRPCPSIEGEALGTGLRGRI